MSGAYSLSNVHAPKLGIICDRCNRRGSYSVEALIAKHGDIVLPALLRIIAAEGKCPNINSQMDGCKAKFSPESIATFSYER